jgi:PAS domain S-box-containing protein
VVVTLASGEALSDVIMGGNRPDGSLVWISINTKPLFRSAESRPSAVVVSFIDITTRQKAEGRPLSASDVVHHF